MGRAARAAEGAAGVCFFGSLAFERGHYIYVNGSFFERNGNLKILFNALLQEAIDGGFIFRAGKDQDEVVSVVVFDRSRQEDASGVLAGYY